MSEGGTKRQQASDIIERARRHFFPTKFAKDFAVDRAVVSVFETHIAPSYAPLAPILPVTARVASIGSCFAEEISKSLASQGVQVSYIWMSERWNSAFALSRFLDRALGGKPFPRGFLKDEASAEESIQPLAESFAAADLFILTFGLSLCWFETGTDQMVLEPPSAHSARGLISAMTEFEMRQTTVADNETEILRCIETVRAAKASAPIVLTLSPVPLLAAVNDLPPIPANLISKGTLRLALDLVMKRKIADVYYWPSYDFIMWFGAHISNAFGDGQRDMRHVRPQLVDILAQFFKAMYFRPRD